MENSKERDDTTSEVLANSKKSAEHAQQKTKDAVSYQHGHVLACIQNWITNNGLIRSED